MGGAVYVALDGEAFFAATPERAEPLRALAANERSAAVIRKTDKLQSVAEAQQLARQVMRVSLAVKQGDREVVRVRPFVRIVTNLSLSTSELSANIPSFNQSRLLASANAAPPAAASGSASLGTPLAEESPPSDDAEVSFVMTDLAPVLHRVKLAGTVAPEDVLARVREAANWTLSTQTASLAPVAPAGPGGRLPYATEASLDPYSGFEPRIIPENITLLPKTASQITGGSNANERTIIAKKSDNVVSIMRELGATPEEAKQIASALGSRGREGGLKDGQKLRVLLSPVGSRMQPVRIMVMGENAPEVVVAFSDNGKYVSVDVQTAETTQVAEADDDEDSGAVRLYQSLYETALRQQVPRPLIDELVRIYSYDVDFQRKVQVGDSFELLYPGDDEGSDGKAEVLYAALTIGGESKRYYRFQTPDDGLVDYYDETGKSAKKFLVRKPVDAAIMRSGYGWRRHPILGYSKMHTGVDWAAPRGTPIFASGAGVVERAGWEGGYGKQVRIRHAYGYETAYGHMSAFARGIAPGMKVRQGQVIGYVGSTGLSTGAHVHYEILVNGRFVDPMRIKLPRGRSLEGSLLASFEQERERVDSMMSRSSHVAEVTPAAAHSSRREASRRDSARR